MNKLKNLLEEQKKQEIHPSEEHYSPPVNSIKLPSRGVVYQPESPLYLVETIDIQPVTAKEENILSSPILIKKGTVLTELMKACITNRTIDPDELLIGDRNAILTAIRISAYGDEYAARVSCPECGESSDYTFNLSKLKLKFLDEQPIGGPGSNEFNFKLPRSGLTATFRLLNARLLSELDKDIEGIRKKTGRDQQVTLRLQKQVVGLSGVEEKKLQQAINSMSAIDSRTLRIYMDSIAPGIDMMQEFDCGNCGKNSEVEIVVGTEFFWPSVK